MTTRVPSGWPAPRRPAAVAGAFYPADPAHLRELVTAELDEAARLAAGVPLASGVPIGLLVPHAGLVYSGVVAATAWRLLEGAGSTTVVILGTNHRAGWLDGLAAWDRGSWVTPLGDETVDEDLASAIVALAAPFGVDREAHLEEHSIEVQLPLLRCAVTASTIVPLAVSFGTDTGAIEAGRRLGGLLRARRLAGARIVLAISSDMAHYPTAAAAKAVTEELLPTILALDPEALAAAERGLRARVLGGRGPRGLACGMCGIEPTVVGLAALGAMGATRGTALATATSADAGGPPDRTVGYLAVRFD